MKSPISFRGFDERGEVRVYKHGILPHWRQEGCTYFVTFRQADSLPQARLDELEGFRQQWLIDHGIDPVAPDWKMKFRRLASSDQREYEKVIGKKLNDYLDAGHGSCSLRDPLIAAVVAKALDHFHEERVLTGDFVIMPNHVHVLFTPFPGFELEEILHSIKSFTSNRINEMRKSECVFWQRESYDHIVRDPEQLEAFQRYITANPEKARLAESDYVLSKGTYCFT